MKFKSILDNIQNEGQLAINQIEADTKRQIDTINRAAEENAEKQRSRILTDGRARLNRETAIIEQQAAVKSLRIHADARQKLIDTALEESRQLFPAIRTRSDYSIILLKLIKEVIKSLTPSLLEGQRIIMYFDERDHSIVEKIMKEQHFDVETRFEITTAGGCTGETGDGKVSSQNTIESRFLRAGALLQKKLSLYFEDKVTSA